MSTATETHQPSRGCYQRGCPSEECALANYRYHKQLELEHQRGERRLHDVTQARVHIEQLLAQKWWLAEIARVAGVPRSSVRKIYAEQQQTHNHAALAILSIPIKPISRTQLGERVNAIGSIRRLRALAYLGHAWMDIGGPIGMTQDRLSVIARGKVEVIRPSEARKIATVYRALSTKPGRMKQIATAARNKGWYGPLAWDDINDPDCKPETGCKSYAKAGSKPKVYADPARVAELTAAGRSAAQIAQELGCHARTVIRARRRAEMAVAA